MPRIAYHMKRIHDGIQDECGKAERLYRRSQSGGKTKWISRPVYECLNCGKRIESSASAGDDDWIEIR